MNFRLRSRGGPTRAIVKWTRRGALLSLLLFSGCAVMTVEQNPGNRAEAYFTAHDPQHRKPQYRTLASDGVTLGYATVGEPDRPAVLFVHGTPGRWGDFVHFLADPQLQRDAYLVSLDRPGWGDSPFAQTPRRVILALQSRSLGPLLERLADASAGCGVVLVGHSLGGSLVVGLHGGLVEHVLPGVAGRRGRQRRADGDGQRKGPRCCAFDHDVSGLRSGGRRPGVAAPRHGGSWAQVSTPQPAQDPLSSGGSGAFVRDRSRLRRRRAEQSRQLPVRGMHAFRLGRLAA